MNPKTDENSRNENLNTDLDNFLAIKTKVVLFALNLLPWGILLVSILALKESDLMLATGLLAAALSLFAFQRLMQQIPHTLTVLWRRNIIAERPNVYSDEAEEELRRTVPSSRSPQLISDFHKYVSNFQSLLNHPAQWIFGFSFIILVYFGWAKYEISSGYIVGFWRVLYPFEFLIGFIIGLMAWRMIITGVEIWRLGKKFDIHPILGHPDKCAGLEPLGNLCLWNALILTVPGVFLGGWIILIPTTSYDPHYIDMFYKLILVPITWAFVTFFMPLLGIHKLLINKRRIIQKQLDYLAKSIDQLSHKILEDANKIEPDEYEKMNKKLEIMQLTYQQYKDYPVWPFNTKILKKFALSQAIPVLSYLGIGEPLLEVAKSVIDTLVGFV